MYLYNYFKLKNAIYISGNKNKNVIVFLITFLYEIKTQ